MSRLTGTELASLSLFGGIDEQLLSGLVDAFYVGPSEGILFEKGDDANALYVLSGGEMTLHNKEHDDRVLRPLALVGEVGALTARKRTCQAKLSQAQVWILEKSDLDRFLATNRELASAINRNAVRLMADKIARDQSRLADMRGNLISTQKVMKELRQYVLASEDSGISDRIHDELGRLIMQNRRVNYRVQPPRALASSATFSDLVGTVVEISRTHLSILVERGELPKPSQTLSGVLNLSGPEIPTSGRVLRTINRRVDIELDPLLEVYGAKLEGYLTQVQMLDYLV